MTTYRVILLEPALARPLQYGGRKGLGIEALHLQVRLWQSSAKHSNQSLGLVFIDIKAAFLQRDQANASILQWNC